jgi:hypothetical protein
LALNEQDGRPSASRRSTRTPAPSSQSGSPEYPTSGTSSPSQSDAPVLLTMREGKDGGGKGPLVSEDMSLTLGTGNGQVLFSSPEASRARTSPTPEPGPGSAGTDPASPSPSSTFWSDTVLDGSSSRTSRDSSLPVEVPISRDSSMSFAPSGMAWRGTSSTVVTSTSLKGGGGSSSSGYECRRPARLRDVLEPSAPERFFLTQRAAAGILRRAAKRGRSLPSRLEEALQVVATSQGPSPQEPTPGPTTGRMPTPGTSSRVRRLTPVEVERLQGYPDGWTIAKGWKRRSRS